MDEVLHPTDYNSPAALKAFLEAHGFSMQKRFGQNFMVNPGARLSIVKRLSPSPESLVWEVGPGLGALSHDILRSGASLTAFEIDRGFAACLHGLFQKEEAEGRFLLREGDVLKTWKGELDAVGLAGKSPSSVLLCGNLPYNVAATFIAQTIGAGVRFRRAVFTVQREVADRMCAAVGSPNYSAFSVLCQWGYKVHRFLDLQPGSFWPRPNVSSAAVVLEPRLQDGVIPAGSRTRAETCSGGASSDFFVRTVHVLFSQRRKTLLNNCKALIPPGVDAAKCFAEAGVGMGERAENLSVGQFAVLSSCFRSAILEQGGRL